MLFLHQFHQIFRKFIFVFFVWYIDTQPIVNISLTEGTYPVAEGGALTLMCSATSNSQPSQYRQNLIYNFHMSIYTNYLQRRADGSVVENDRYTMIDDRTLRINPVSSTDQGWVHCHICEYSCNIINVAGVNSNVQVLSQNGEIYSFGLFNSLPPNNLETRF